MIRFLLRFYSVEPTSGLRRAGFRTAACDEIKLATEEGGSAMGTATATDAAALDGTVLDAAAIGCTNGCSIDAATTGTMDGGAAGTDG